MNSDEVKLERGTLPESLPNFKSPINNIKMYIYNSLVIAAPSKVEEIVKLVEELNIGWLTFRKPTFYFCTHPSSHNIDMTLQSIEFLWCIAYSSWHLDRFATKKHFKDDKFIKFENSDLEHIGKLLNWSIGNIMGKLNEWPTDCPVPNLNGNKDDDIVNSLFSIILAWILFHEIGHLKLGHNIGGVRAYKEELEADSFATNMLIDSMPEEKTLTIQLGIVHGLSILFIWEIILMRLGGEEHPPATERFSKQLDILNIDDNHKSLFFVTTVINMFLKAQGINVDRSKCKTQKEILYESFFVFHDYIKKSRGM